MKPNYLIWLTALLCLTLNGVASAKNILPPKKLTLTYEVSKEGQPVATVSEIFTHDGRNYRIESITKGKGFYALLGERKLISTGAISAAGLQPKHFESHQGDNPKKFVSADFDWQKLTLSMVRKGQVSTEPLNAGAQDLLSFGYQFMFVNLKSQAAKPSGYTVYLTTGKKYRPYKFSIKQPKKLIGTSAGSFTTSYLKELTAGNAPASKELWLGLKNKSVDGYQLPIKLIIRDDNNTFEQVLTSINAE